MTAEKARWRERFRARRRATDPAALATASDRIAARLAELIDERGGRGAVALFWPLPGEVDLRTLAEALRQSGAAVALPAVTGPRRLEWRRFEGSGQLVEARWGLREPDPSAEEIAPHALAVVAIPGLAFGRDGTRLGYGGGFYDARLGRDPRVACRRVGVGGAGGRGPVGAPRCPPARGRDGHGDRLDRPSSARSQTVAACHAGLLRLAGSLRQCGAAARATARPLSRNYAAGASVRSGRTPLPPMPTRSRSRSAQEGGDVYDDEFSFVSDDDVLAYMAEQELEEETEEKKQAGFWNLQTASGMGLIGLGALYSIQQLGFLPFGFDLSGLVQVLPILAAVLIMLTGFGVLSWSPAARRRAKARKRAARRRRQRRNVSQRKTVGRAPQDEAGRRASSAFAQAEKALGVAGQAAGRAVEEAKARRASARRKGRTRLLKDRANRKLTGLSAGMANYFGLDPTVVRIGWVLATIFTQGGALVPYIILSMIVGNEDDARPDDDPVIRVSR